MRTLLTLLVWLALQRCACVAIEAAEAEDSTGNLVAGIVPLLPPDCENTIYGCGAGAFPLYTLVRNVLVGFEAGRDLRGRDVVAIGFQAGRSAGDGAVAVGFQAGFFNQHIDTVAVGAFAGAHLQGKEAVAIGASAGESFQGSSAVSVGGEAGQEGQGSGAIAIGFAAGQEKQGEGAIALGTAAGLCCQGEYAIAIGAAAGTAQAAYSIVINAQGVALDNSQNPHSLYIAPVRPQSGGYALSYHPTCGEITYDSAKTFVIDHPLEPGKYLVHACLEGPESGVYYRGEGEIKAGASSVVINLPDYVDKIASDFNVQITPIYTEGDAIVSLAASRVVNNRFSVCGAPGAFYWVVYGKRLSIDVEPEKATTSLKRQGPYTWID
jgi:hypothetical protein